MVANKEEEEETTTIVHAFFFKCKCIVQHLNFFVFHPLFLKFFEPTQGRERNKGVRASVCAFFLFCSKGIKAINTPSNISNRLSSVASLTATGI